MKQKLILLLLSSLLTACAVGPNYQRPAIPMTAKFKEAPKGWKIAEPRAAENRGPWWYVFKDPELNALEERVNGANQNIAVAIAQIKQARALICEAESAYFPLVNASATVIRQSQPAGSAFFNSNLAGVSPANPGPTRESTLHTLQGNASWEIDLWGSTRRNVEANVAGEHAAVAQFATVQLTAAATMAQTYFQIRTVDQDQKLLDDTAISYKKSLELTQNRYRSGVASRGDVVQAQTQLETAQAAAINNHILRAQLEHAMAVLMGVPPAAFSLPVENIHRAAPTVPVQVPCALLERRPDVAHAEYLAIQANAQIGVAIAAYFPSLTLNATGGFESTNLARWLTVPSLFWTVGPTLAQTLFDGGLRHAVTAAARANYEATVGTYRQTVLTAFQDVEDNLASVRLLTQQSSVQNQAAESAKQALKLVLNQYKAGTAAYSDVILAQINAYTAEKSAIDVHGQQLTSTVTLIKALGGGWG